MNRFRPLPWLAAACIAIPAAAGAQLGSSASSAPAAREACADAARTLVRQPTGWEDAEHSFSGSATLRWRAANGTRGFCKIDARGRVYEVKVEQWGVDDDLWVGPGGDSRSLTEERGFDRRGDDYDSVRLRSLSDCQATCRRDERCRAYTWSAREGRCWLKSKVNSPEPDRDMVTGYKTENDAGGPGGGGRGRVSEEWGLDRRGSDFSTFRSDRLADCQDACEREGRCRAYTFDTRNRLCYLKDRVNAPQPDAGMVTGTKDY
jgi:hypothetical protein